LESFVAVLREVNVRYKTRASLRLTGIGEARRAEGAQGQP
jgi:hypothetical protein